MDDFFIGDVRIVTMINILDISESTNVERVQPRKNTRSQIEGFEAILATLQ